MASGCGVALQLQTPSMSSFLIKQRVPAHKRRPGWEDGSDESDESDERVNLMAAERPRRSMRRSSIVALVIPKRESSIITP